MLLTKFFLILGFNLVVIRICVRNSGKKVCGKTDRDCGEYIDSIILSLKSGMSFENALREYGLTKAQSSTEISSVINFCRRHPSQCFTVLTSYREVQRLQKRLALKQAALTSQAKMQAIVACFLYLLLLFSQWKLNESFTHTLSLPSGRVWILISLVLMVAGTQSVLRMARPRELKV